jgi:hypothetical protein
MALALGIAGGFIGGCVCTLLFAKKAAAWGVQEYEGLKASVKARL